MKVGMKKKDPKLREAVQLVIHGHFYQPPRENPWTEVIEPEPSARPFHDWNERIYQECYRANGNARVVREGGLVESIVNNYLNLSFNFGPTLLSWMEKEHAHGYQKLLDADKASIESRGGHGNAIAQGYNHCILPLCNEHDRVTQIRWGIKEFRYRFKREPESLWLPETACNLATLGALIDEGLKYLILAPGQCARVRPLDHEGDWQEIHNGELDPGRAYAHQHPDGSGRSIAIFFYDGPIAQAIAFGEGLKSSQDFVGVLGRAPQAPGRLVSVATDGESYGHHTKWGDRTLAHALTREAEHQGYHVTNYGQYLEEYPPQWECQIKEGPDGEGTAWSCAHGVGRWIRDCGCQTGGQPGWNQAWRGPLRRALDLLRDYAADCISQKAAPLLKDVWAARNDFIDVLLDPSDEARRRFLDAHQTRPLSPEEGQLALGLLDTQRQAMLMYTSCGWFFTDMSGIETLQILKYACRLMDDLAALGFHPPRKEFLEMLAEARSNMHELGSGADIFKKLVEPAKVTRERLAAHLAISSLVQAQEMGEFGAYRFTFSKTHREALGRTRLLTGRIELSHRISGRSTLLMFAATHLGGVDFHACVARWEDEQELEQSTQKVSQAFRSGMIPGLMRAMREEFGVREFGLGDLLGGGRERIVGMAFGDLVGRLSQDYTSLYGEHRRSLELFQASGFSLPYELRMAAEYALSREFAREVREQGGSSEPSAYARALEIADEAQRLGYRLDRDEAAAIFSTMINEAVRQAMISPDSSQLENAIGLLELAGRLSLKLNVDRAQEFAVAGEVMHSPERLSRLAELLRLEATLLTKTMPPGAA